MNDIIEITTNDGTDISPIVIESFNSKNSSSDKPSVNFGPGVELLMNDKHTKHDDSKGKTNLDDLTAIENELNNLTNSENGKTHSIDNGIKLNIFDNNNTKSNESNKPKIVDETIDNHNNNNTNTKWDGFKKFDTFPVNPDLDVENKPKLNNDELLREKFKLLRRLEQLEKKGVNLSKKYTMDSELSEMKGEYEMIIAEKEKSASSKFQGRMLMAAVTGLEFLNNRFDPFDVKLDGWAEQLNENIDDYDEIFGELHEKYKSKAKLAPELKLLFQLGGSAIMVHMTNTMFKSAMPGMDDIMRQNPELMQQFTQAAVNSMGESSPGFGGFMNEVINDNNVSPNISSGPPPEPVRTKVSRSERSQIPNNRPDINAARGDGLDLNDNFEKVGPQPPIKSTAGQRPEMKGPSDISELLSGLKTKNIDINSRENEKDGSTISIQELKDLSETKQPSRTKRRQKSDKNVVSLEL
tara:strand:- start:7072 stop:8472 length:1401 start_codon:yes stop_codon:yes gene_type:complete